MLGDALAFPRRSDDSFKTILIGGACLFFSFLFVPVLFMQGYFMRILEEGGGDAEPPSFEDAERLFIDGIKMYAIQFVFTAVPWIIGIALFAVIGASVLTMGAAAGGGSGVGAVAVLVMLVGFLVLAIVGIAAMYVVPAAMTLAARTGEVSAAFDLDRLKLVATSSEYFTGFLLYLVVIIVGTIVGILLVIVFFLGLFVMFYVQMSAFYVISTAVDRALDGHEDAAAGSATPA